MNDFDSKRYEKISKIIDADVDSIYSSIMRKDTEMAAAIISSKGKELRRLTEDVIVEKRYAVVKSYLSKECECANADFNRLKYLMFKQGFIDKSYVDKIGFFSIFGVCILTCIFVYACFPDLNMEKQILSFVASSLGSAFITCFIYVLYFESKLKSYFGKDY